MSPEYQNALIENGTDYHGTLVRLAGSESLYEKLLQKFLLDPNYPNLKLCIEQKNYSEAFQYAHTLKGVTGNLGLNRIYALTHPIVELLREQKTEGIDELFPPLELAYLNICTIIRTYA